MVMYNYENLDNGVMKMKNQLWTHKGGSLAADSDHTLNKVLEETRSWKGKSVLTLKNHSPEEIKSLLKLALELKNQRRFGRHNELLKGKNIVLLFEKTSTRTRCAFEVAMMQEGGNATFLDMKDSQMGKKESVEDTAKVLGRYYEGIEFRGYSQKTVEALSAHAGVPVWNGLTDDYHPTQILADWMTIMEKVDKPLEEVTIAYVGDARNNMAHSLMIGAAKMGMKFRAVSPVSLAPDKALMTEMEEVAKETGGTIEWFENPSEGVKGADVIYTDVWVSMGEEEQFEERIKLLKPYQVNGFLMNKTGNPETIFMHCLPAFHDTETLIGKEVYEKHGISELEVTDEVFRSSKSVVFDEAENRMHTIKAMLIATMGPTGHF